MLPTKYIVSLNVTYYRLNFNNGQSIKIKNIESVQKCIKNIYLHPCDEFTGKPFFYLSTKHRYLLKETINFLEVDTY